MADRPLERVRRFLAELRRRNVYRVAVVYATVAFVIVQSASLIFPALDIPPWGYSLVVVLALLGFPVAVVLAWAFEISPEGRARATSSPEDAEGVDGTGIRWLVGFLVLLTAGAAGAVAVGGVSPGTEAADRTATDSAEGASSPTEEDAEGGELALSPRRIAVLYFDVLSPGDSLRSFARGLTEDLIHQLEQADQLDVISRHGVAPYRAGGVGLDSIVRSLRAGSIVEGSVEEAHGDSISVTVQLIDGETQSHLMSEQLTRPASDPFALQQEVAREVSRLLRERLGRDIRLGTLRAEASSPRAWSNVQTAERLREDARRLKREGSRDGARRLALRADSLLEEAASLDTTWSEPLVLRARLAGILVDLLASTWTDGEREEVRERIRFADRAVRRGDRRVDGLVARGWLRFWLSQHIADPAPARKMLDAAENDLRKAVRVDESSARAWYSLSVLLHEGRGRLEEARLAAERAREADSFLSLEPPRLVRAQLFETAVNVPDYEDARYWCELGREQNPERVVFRECELILLASRGGPEPDVGRARELVEEIRELSNDRNRPFFTAIGWRRYAAVLARAGRDDSARSVLGRAPESEPEGALHYEEAHVHLLLGEREQALEKLGRMLEAMPEGYAARIPEDPWFAPLRGDPRFQEIVSGAGR